MDHDVNTNPPAKRRGLILVVGLFAFVIGFAARSVLVSFEPASTPDFATQNVLRHASPVELAVRFRPRETQVVKATNGEIKNYEGPIEYHFTNRSKESIKASFPPSRSFSFGANGISLGSENIPFPKWPRVVELKPGEAVTVEDTYGVSLTGEAHSFLEGGLGPFAFVFSRPSDAASDDGYLVGTVFGTYSVEVQAENK